MKTPILIFLVIALVSCKKEIQIKLNSKESKVVIEADIAGSNRNNTVHITQTGGLSRSNDFTPVSGALVIITDGQGYQETLTEEQTGYYHTSAFAGVAGRTYYMTVLYDNKTYEAQSTIQTPVKLDTVLVIRGSYAGTAMDGFMPVYTDVAGTKNYYRFVQFLNGKRIPGSILRDDEFTDGQPARQPIMRMDLHLQPGDKYEVEMQCVDQAIYKYFTSKAQTANMENAAPANPVSNISNGALGYFNVFMPQNDKVVIQD
jgi:hypothetical protein